LQEKVWQGKMCYSGQKMIRAGHHEAKYVMLQCFIAQKCSSEDKNNEVQLIESGNAVRKTKNNRY
jgi:hypothetical protein